MIGLCNPRLTGTDIRSEYLGPRRGLRSGIILLRIWLRDKEGRILLTFSRFNICHHFILRHPPRLPSDALDIFSMLSYQFSWSPPRKANKLMLSCDIEWFTTFSLVISRLLSQSLDNMELVNTRGCDWSASMDSRL
mgnify:CR=1 FL=1